MLISNFSLKNQIQKILCVINEVFDFNLYHPVRELRKIALIETVEYIQNNMVDCLSFYTAKELFDAILPQVSQTGSLVEFGVYKGGSANYIAKKFPDRQLYGFDSFKGLPEAWGGFTLNGGVFKLRENTLPRVRSNVKLEVGLFSDSIPVWKQEDLNPIALMHIDCDLYSSTCTILELLGGRLIPGSIIVFDEYFGYPNWKNHEHKAFMEFCAEKNIIFEYIGYSRVQVAVKILSNPS